MESQDRHYNLAQKRCAPFISNRFKGFPFKEDPKGKNPFLLSSSSRVVEAVKRITQHTRDYISALLLSLHGRASGKRSCTQSSSGKRERSSRNSLAIGRDRHTVDRASSSSNTTLFRERKREQKKEKGKKKRVLCVDIQGHSPVTALAKATQLLLHRPAFTLCIYRDTRARGRCHQAT